MEREKRILVAPLDWGLGHAARCIPLIRMLQAQGASPFLASSGRAFRLLEKEFPDLPLLPIAPYGIRYPGSNMVLNLSCQLPSIMCAAGKEHLQVQQLVRRYGLCGVIADNRLGAFSRQARSVYLTHQLHIMTSRRRLTALINKVHHWFIRQYDECWVPDTAAVPGLAGALSHPPLPGVRYIGPLSRFSTPAATAPNRYELLVLLSGPEPQRSRLEARLLAQLRSMHLSVLFVQGKTETERRWKAAPNIDCVSYLTAQALEDALAASRLVVCRSGYSTIMDLARMKHRALFIPTPGQSEQEYLARMLQEQNITCYVEQSEVCLPQDLEKVETFQGFSREEAYMERLDRAVGDFLDKV